MLLLSLYILEFYSPIKFKTEHPGRECVDVSATVTLPKNGQGFWRNIWDHLPCACCVMCGWCAAELGGSFCLSGVVGVLSFLCPVWIRGWRWTIRCVGFTDLEPLCFLMSKTDLLLVPCFPNHALLIRLYLGAFITILIFFLQEEESTVVFLHKNSKLGRYESQLLHRLLKHCHHGFKNHCNWSVF